MVLESLTANWDINTVAAKASQRLGILWQVTHLPTHQCFYNLQGTNQSVMEWSPTFLDELSFNTEYIHHLKHSFLHHQASVCTIYKTHYHYLPGLPEHNLPSPRLYHCDRQGHWVCIRASPACCQQNHAHHSSLSLCCNPRHCNQKHCGIIFTSREKQWLKMLVHYYQFMGNKG